jgi:hypothetical protein
MNFKKIIFLLILSLAIQQKPIQAYKTSIMMGAAIGAISSSVTYIAGKKISRKDNTNKKLSLKELVLYTCNGAAIGATIFTFVNFKKPAINNLPDPLNQNHESDGGNGTQNNAESEKEVIAKENPLEYDNQGETLIENNPLIAKENPPEQKIHPEDLDKNKPDSSESHKIAEKIAYAIKNHVQYDNQVETLIENNPSIAKEKFIFETNDKSKTLLQEILEIKPPQNYREQYINTNKRKIVACLLANGSEPDENQTQEIVDMILEYDDVKLLDNLQKIHPRMLTGKSFTVDYNCKNKRFASRFIQAGGTVYAEDELFKKENLSLLKELTLQRPEIIREKTKNNDKTPLFSAMQAVKRLGTDDSVIDFLLENNTDITTPIFDRSESVCFDRNHLKKRPRPVSPLAFAIWYRNEQWINKLIAHGAVPCAEDVEIARDEWANEIQKGATEDSPGYQICERISNLIEKLGPKKPGSKS